MIRGMLLLHWRDQLKHASYTLYIEPQTTNYAN